MKAGAITVIVIASVEAVALLLGVEMDTLLPAYSTYAAYVLAFGGLLVGWFVAAYAVRHQPSFFVARFEPRKLTRRGT
jgi:hypothetical protein